ncbi:MAG TPA: hypothetical protein VM076_16475 [Gemmatimonadaceae bacterium]|nr:hypothetical protein [Gemmatimonadaceae bacterium]
MNSRTCGPPNEWPTTTHGAVSPLAASAACRSSGIRLASNGGGPASLHKIPARLYAHTRVVRAIES